MADEPERAEPTHVDLGMPASASDGMTVHFVRQADALTSCSSAAVATSIMHGASADIAVAIGAAVQNSILSLLVFASVELRGDQVEQVFSPSLPRPTLIGAPLRRKLGNLLFAHTPRRNMGVPQSHRPDL